MSIIKELYEYICYMVGGLFFGFGVGYILFNLVEFLTPLVK